MAIGDYNRNMKTILSLFIILGSSLLSVIRQRTAARAGSLLLVSRRLEPNWLRARLGEIPPENTLFGGTISGQARRGCSPLEAPLLVLATSEFPKLQKPRPEILKRRPRGN